ncbi:MAG: ATP-binding protein [Magnetococcales bacterium]|nr:ATP-binding protein [Magnetococcales bacterium]
MQDDKSNNKVPGVAPLRNVAALSEAIEATMGRPQHLPGIVCFHGLSGLGKTTAATYAHVEYCGAYVAVRSVVSRKSLLTSILKELGVSSPKGSLDDYTIEVARILVGTRKPLIIDEADYLAKPSLVEVIQDIHDAAVGSTIVLIGEENLKTKLARWEKIHNRILRWEGAQLANLADALLLRDLHCRRVRVADDLVGMFGEKTGWVPRRICVNLAAAEEEALSKGRTEIGLKEYRREVFTGSPPMRRVA